MIPEGPSPTIPGYGGMARSIRSGRAIPGGGAMRPAPRPARPASGLETGDGMSTMNREVYDALVDAGADEAKAREAAKSVARHDGDIAEIKASLLLLKWMMGFTLAFVVAMAWRTFA